MATRARAVTRRSERRDDNGGGDSEVDANAALGVVDPQGVEREAGVAVRRARPRGEVAAEAPQGADRLPALPADAGRGPRLDTQGL